MGLFMGLMMNGRKHGQHDPLMIEKNACVGHKCGS
jgi:hypothetical protein